MLNYKSLISKRTALSLCGASVLISSLPSIAKDEVNKNDILTDGSYVTLKGTVGAIYDGDEFELNHNGGTIKVDTNDIWPDLFRQDAGEVLNKGDRISVTGIVDDNLFLKKELDATTIKHSGTNYSRIYFDMNDKHYDAHYYYSGDSMDDKEVSLTGNITKIVNDEEFVLSYSGGTIQVETDGIAFPDTDRLKKGDLVTVYGEIDKDWFEAKKLEADRIVRTNYYPTRS